MAWVLFFDGDCGFCNQSVRRISRWDEEGLIHFAPLQGKLSSKHKLTAYLEGDQASMVLLNEEDDSILTQSDGVLQIFRILGGGWKLLLIGACLPKSWRDALYRVVARNRHRIAPKQQQVCEMPSQELLSRIRE